MRWAWAAILGMGLRAALGAVTVDPPSWQPDHGLLRGAKLQRRFALRNSGAQRVKLLGVKFTGPVFARANLPAIPAHGDAPLDVWLNAPDTYGPLTGVVEVSLEGAPPVKLTVRGEVVPAWRAGLLPAEIGTGHYPPHTGPPVVVQFLYKQGCEHCMTALLEVVRPLERYFGPAARFECIDLTQPDGPVTLERLKQAYGVTADSNTYAFVGGQALSDIVLDDKLYRLVLAELKQPTPAPALPPVKQAAAAVDQRLARFGPWGALAIGAADGLNPCAFATIVFLIALLTRLGHSRRTMLAAGLAYCGAVYVTYTLLGLGVLHALSWFGNRLVLARLLRWGVALWALWFAALQVRDVRALGRGTPTRELSVQLPPRLKRGVHALLRWSTDPRWGALAIGAATAAAGVSVTLIEMACTSQLYLPVLLLLQTSGWRQRALGLLLAYNVGFVLPLAVVVVAAVGGLRSERVAGWARANLSACKLALAALLAGLAVVLVVWR